jgi:small nuclear ribonucleoprotein B and B'
VAEHHSCPVKNWLGVAAPESHRSDSERVARVINRYTANMASSSKRGMVQYVNYRMRITLDDSRVLVGRFMAFDQHMNLVLADCEEFRRTKKKDVSEKRALGLVLLRGECVVLLSVESAPPPPPKKRPAHPLVGRGAPISAVGRGAPMGRGTPAMGLAGPVPGIGIPAAAMQPHIAAQPQAYQQMPVYGRGAPTAPPGWMGRGVGPPMAPPPGYVRGDGGPPPGPPPPPPS